MKITIFLFIFFLSFIMISCNNRKADVPEARFAEISEVIAGIDSSLLDYEYILLLPRNACGGCIELTLRAAPQLLETGKTVIITEILDERVEDTEGVKYMTFDTLKRDMEIYGITLIQEIGQKRELIHLSPENLEREYRKIVPDLKLFE